MAIKQSSRKSSSRKSGTRSPVAGSPRKSPSRRLGSKSSSGGGGRSSGRKPASKGGSRSGATRQSTRTASTGRKSSGTGGATDALKLLKQDHDNVGQMFRKYDRMKDGDPRKPALREQILEELRVHAQVEEELFYPALKTRFEQGGKAKQVALIEEADVEHETVKWLIEQLEGGDQSDEGMSDARVKVLGEYVRHHVEEEEGEIFKAAKKVELDLVELGRQMDARKRQLKGEAPADSEGESAGDDSLRINEPAQLASGWSEH